MLDSSRNIDVAIVIVLYYPDDETLDFIEDFSSTGADIVAVVNAIESYKIKRILEMRLWKTVINESNEGLAKALNQGCVSAFEGGSNYVFLLDQDSRPDFDLHKKLISDWIELGVDNIGLGAIGPNLVDIKSSNVEKKSDLKISLATNTIATSGTLISREAYDIVGPMNEWLFIDCIDHDWCFRARLKGLVVMQIAKRKMLHNMGDDGVTIFGRYRPLHCSPTRHYYILRNTLFMICQSHVPLRWRFREAAKLVYRVPVYLLISTNTRDTVRSMMAVLMGQGVPPMATKNVLK